MIIKSILTYMVIAGLLTYMVRESNNELGYSWKDYAVGFGILSQFICIIALIWTAI